MSAWKIPRLRWSDRSTRSRASQTTPVESGRIDRQSGPHWGTNLDGSRVFDIFPRVKPGESVSRRFRALADETRLRIIDRLRDGEECVCNLTGPLGMRQSLLSFHLRTLKDAGIVRDRKEGRWVYYSLNLDVLDEMLATLEALKKPRKGLRLVVPRCE